MMRDAITLAVLPHCRHQVALYPTAYGISSKKQESRQSVLGLARKLDVGGQLDLLLVVVNTCVCPTYFGMGCLVYFTTRILR
jgi:hypothetical protein